VNITVSFDFTKIGKVSLEGGKLRFPKAPEAPGIYRFEIRDRIYVGETDRLGRRFQHYRTPGISQPTNVRLNESIRAALNDGLEVFVSTIEAAKINVEGIESNLDLSKKK
jgi:hypothetical protein